MLAKEPKRLLAVGCIIDRVSHLDQGVPEVGSQFCIVFSD